MESYGKHGSLSKDYYNDFLLQMTNRNFIEIGRAVTIDSGNWSYLVGSIHTIRIYDRRTF